MVSSRLGTDLKHMRIARYIATERCHAFQTFSLVLEMRVVGNKLYDLFFLSGKSFLEVLDSFVKLTLLAHVIRFQLAYT